MSRLNKSDEKQAQVIGADLKLLLWECRYSANIWKGVERQKRERFNINLELKNHTVLLPGNFPDPTHFPRQIFAISALRVKNSLCLGEGLLNGCVELPKVET